jgi:hypothetical protein
MPGGFIIWILIAFNVKIHYFPLNYIETKAIRSTYLYMKKIEFFILFSEYASLCVLNFTTGKNYIIILSILCGVNKVIWDAMIMPEWIILRSILITRFAQDYSIRQRNYY